MDGTREVWDLKKHRIRKEEDSPKYDGLGLTILMSRLTRKRRFGREECRRLRRVSEPKPKRRRRAKK